MLLLSILPTAPAGTACSHLQALTSNTDSHLPSLPQHTTPRPWCSQAPGWGQAPGQGCTLWSAKVRTV